MLTVTRHQDKWWTAGRTSGRIPAGYTFLPDGPTRRIRVNKYYLQGDKERGDAPYFYVLPNENLKNGFGGFKVHCHDIRILGSVRLVCGFDEEVPNGA
jgi:hypothetical protein